MSRVEVEMQQSLSREVFCARPSDAWLVAYPEQTNIERKWKLDRHNIRASYIKMVPVQGEWHQLTILSVIECY